ncbi:MAG: hypothetical protein ACXQT5_00165 [Candidatus Syntropharchaeia archaeon]
MKLISLLNTISEGSMEFKVKGELLCRIDRKNIVLDLNRPIFFHSKGDIKSLLSDLRDFASELDKNEKTFLLKYKEKNILKLGYGARSFFLGLFGFKSMEIPDKLMLMKFILDRG